MSDKPKCGCGKSQDANGFCDGSHKNNEEQLAFKETKIVSFGETLMEIDFDLSEDSSDYKVKKLMAEATNVLREEYVLAGGNPVRSILFEHALGQIVNAQMSINKVITLK
jgi:hypothetical protein